MDAQEAHLYAFPLITGRGQWLPLHNGFASASHLLPASLGEEEVKEEEEWRDGRQRWLVNQTWPCEGTHTYTQMSVTYGAPQFVLRQTLIPLSEHGRKTWTYAKGIRGAQDLGLNSAS